MPDQPDPVADLLRKTPTTPTVRAAAWDAFQQATTPDELATALKAINMPNSAKADLWDLKSRTGAAPATAPSPTADQGGDVLLDNIKNVANKAIGWLPSVGGAVGGLIGGAGGTVAGMGVGAVPGAIGGAALGAAGGEAARQLINRATGAAAPATPLDAAAQIAKEGAIQGGAQAVGSGAAALMRPYAQDLMQGALKPTLGVLKEYGTTPTKLVKTLLDEGVSVTEGGIAKLQGLLASNQADIKAAVQSATGSIAKKDVAARTLSTAGRLAEQTNPTADLNALGDTVDEFMNHPVITGPTMSIPEAQAMKVGTYQQIGKKYGEMNSASIETQKALARGLKEEIAAAVPEIGKLNMKEADLMAALDSVGRRVAVAGNRDPVGFAWVAHAPQTFLAALIDRSPMAKSLIARGFYNAAGSVAKVSPQAIALAVRSLAASGDDAPPSGQE